MILSKILDKLEYCPITFLKGNRWRVDFGNGKILFYLFDKVVEYLDLTIIGSVQEGRYDASG